MTKLSELLRRPLRRFKVQATDSNGQTQVVAEFDGRGDAERAAMQVARMTEHLAVASGSPSDGDSQSDEEQRELLRRSPLRIFFPG